MKTTGEVFELFAIEFYKRPVLYAALCFIAGIAAASKNLLHPFAALAFLCAALLGFILMRKAFPLFLIAFFFFSAIPYYSWMTGYPAGHIKDYAACFGWNRAEVTGRIVADPDIVRSTGTANILLEIESFKVKGLPETRTFGTVKLALKEKIEYGDLNYGDRIRVSARFHVPGAPKNPGEFNYKRYLARKGIFLTGIIEPAAGDTLEKLGEGKKNLFVFWTINIKHRLLLSLLKTTRGEAAFMIQGVLLGEDSGLSAERKQQFRDTGTFHILAVSGFNVALVVAAFFFVLRFLKYKKKISAGVSIIFVIVFCFVTGCSPSVVRASLICVFALLGVLLERDADIINLLALSALLMLFAAPDTLFDIGFQLSYVSTLGLILLAARVEEYLSFLPRLIAGAAAVTISAQLFVAPVSALYFNSFSLVTLPANLCIAPFVWFSTVAGLIQAVLGLVFIPAGILIGYVNSWAVLFMFKVVEFFSSFSFALFRVAAPGFFFLLVYYSAVLTLVYFKKLYCEKPALLAVLSGLMALVIWLNIFTAGPEPEITILALRNSRGVFASCGPEASVLYIEGRADAYEVERKILPLLHSKGVNKLGALVYSADFEPFVAEFRPKTALKLEASGEKTVGFPCRGGGVIYAGGKAPLSGSFFGENFFADKEKLVFGRKRTMVFYKETKKSGAITIILNKDGWSIKDNTGQ